MISILRKTIRVNNLLINCRRCSNKVIATKNQNQLQAVILTVIGSGAPGEPASICLSTSKFNYLFNAGEGSYRLAAQKNIDIKKIQHIFITQNKWSHIGGILSFIMNVYNRTKQLPRFYGTMHLYKCIRRIFCTSIFSYYDFGSIEMSDRKYYEDDAIRIDFVEIDSNEMIESNGETLPRDDSKIFVYICELKCETGDDNFQHKPVHFIVLDISTKEQLKKLIENQQFKSYSDGLLNEGTCLDFVVHFSPQQITQSPEYRDLISFLGPKFNVHLDERNKSSRLKSVYELQSILNQIDRHIHPCLRMDLDERMASVCDICEAVAEDTLYSTYFLRGSTRDQDPKECIDASNLNKTTDISIDRLKTFPRIVFLGTVSSTSSPYRNSTSILVHTNNRTCILMDCGEGTCSQIYRLYGNGAHHIFQKIKAVFISHLHADHFVGLTELLRLRKKYLKPDRKPLIVLCPKANLKSWLFFYDNVIEPIHNDLVFVENENLMNRTLGDPMCKILGVKSLSTCRVPHFDMAYAVSMCIGLDFKLTFSGDTPKCDDLIKLGANSTLLIHEATYPDQYIQKAIQNRHSTVAQAIEQSTEMNAKYTILTHFSQRFGNKLPYIDTNVHSNVGVAFDFMEIIESDLPKLSFLYENYCKEFDCYR